MRPLRRYRKLLITFGMVLLVYLTGYGFYFRNVAHGDQTMTIRDGLVSEARIAIFDPVMKLHRDLRPSDFLAVPWDKRSEEITRDEISLRHHQLLMAPMPEYADSVLGIERPSAHLYDGEFRWTFRVPDSNRNEFWGYLQSIGVDSEYLKSGEYSRPPETELIDIGTALHNQQMARSLTCEKAGEFKSLWVPFGVSFSPEHARHFQFDHPKLAGRDVHLIYSLTSGYVVCCSSAGRHALGEDIEVPGPLSEHSAWPTIRKLPPEDVTEDMWERFAVRPE